MINNRRVQGTGCCSLAVNPVKNRTVTKKLPTKKRQEQLYLTPQEVSDLAEALDDEQLRVLVYLAADTGIRFGEAIGLRVEDYSPLNRRLHVRRSVTRKKGGWNVNDTKGHRDERTLTVGSHVAPLLQALTANKAPSDNVFTDPDPSHPYLRHKGFNALWRAAAQQSLPADQAAVRTHDLRHTMVAVAVEAGANLMLIRDRCGHADIQTTVNVYGHLFPDADESLVTKTDELWSNVIPLRDSNSEAS